MQQPLPTLSPALNVLLVGATGQIGHALAQALTAQGVNLTVLVRRALPGRFAPSVRVVVAQSFTPAAFAEVLAGQDVAVYGVGMPEQFTFDAQVFEQVNHGLLKQFLVALEASPVRRLIYVSTYEVFASQDGVIRENHPVANEAGLSPYFAAMTRAYRHVLDRCQVLGVALTTIHPAALYGGLDTADGFTHFLENILNHRVWNIPTVLPGRFPVVHARSLAQAVLKAFDHAGPFIVSDGMTSLKSLALALRQQTHCYVPPSVPAPLAYAGTAMMEAVARALHLRPPLSRVQLDFITSGVEPRADKAAAVLGWQPWALDRGLKTYLEERPSLLALGRG